MDLKIRCERKKLKNLLSTASKSKKLVAEAIVLKCAGVCGGVVRRKENRCDGERMEGWHNDVVRYRAVRGGKNRAGRGKD